MPDTGNIMPTATPGAPPRRMTVVPPWVAWPLRRFGGGALIIAMALHAVAQLPVPKLAWVFPAGAQIGTTNRIVITGTELDDPETLRANDTGLTATPVPGKPGEFTVFVPSNHPVGLTELRFSGRFGLSNPRPFQVTGLPEFIAPATNTTATSAIPLPLETTANGRVYPNTAAWFRFDAQAGQRLFVRVQARDLASRLVPDLMIADNSGREVALARRRELLDFNAPSAGTFLLRLNDQTYRGGDDYHFRLTLTEAPQLDLALPNSLRVGETNRVALFGRKLPGGTMLPFPAPDGRPWEQLTVEIAAPPAALGTNRQLPGRPASASLAPEAFNWSLATTNGSSNPLLFTLTTNAEVVSLTNSLTPVTPPCEFSALFPARGDVAGVTFTAKKGDVLWLELTADRLGFPSDPQGVVQRERGTKGEHGETLFADVMELGDTDANLGDREFNTSHRDAAGRFEAPETGNYRVLVRDLFNSTPGRPRYAFRLSLRHETPDFRLVALGQSPPKANNDDRNLHVSAPVLRRGQTLPVRVLVFRRDGFGGDLELTATNLPTGVTAATTRVAAGQNSSVILLTASDDASGAANATLLGRAVINDRPVIRTAPLAFLQWPVPDYNNEAAASRLATDSVISVCAAELAPLTLGPAEAKTFEAPAGGKLVLPLRVTRRGQFTGAFNLKAAGHPELDKAKEFTVPEKATNATIEINLAETKLPEGIHTLWLQGSIAGKYRNNPEALAVAETALKEAEKAVAAATDKDKPPLEERRKAAEATKKAAEERAKPRDLTLPVWSQPFTVKITPAPKPEEKK